MARPAKPTYRDLILDASDVEQGLDLGPQLVPWPGTELQVLAQVALDNLEGQTLLLALEEVLTGQVTTHPGLHPGHDLGQTLVTELLHLTQHSGTEEHLSTSQSTSIRIRSQVGVSIEVNVKKG